MSAIHAIHAVRAVRAFDGERALPGGATVLVADSRIVGVTPAGAPVPDGWPLVEFPDATLLPGLVDAHVHLCGDSRDGALDRVAAYTEPELDAVVTESLRRHLAAGVTTVRDLGDRDYVTLRPRPGPAPTVVAAGPPITSPRGHCWFLGGEADGVASLREAVRQRVLRGVGVVKLMGSGGAMTAGTDVMRCQFTDEELRSAVAEAHAAGLPVTVHAHGLPAVEQALAAGADGIEHCTGLTDRGIELPDDLLDRLATAGTLVCPTLGRTPDASPNAVIAQLMQRSGLTWEFRQRTAARMHRAGVRLVSGSDGGISAGKPHGILHLAVADLVLGGVPAADALATATSLGADACGLGHRKGRLRPGYDADLLLVHGDAFTDPDALGRPAAVLLAGAWAYGP